jgi:hypothetical protein
VECARAHFAIDPTPFRVRIEKLKMKFCILSCSVIAALTPFASPAQAEDQSYDKVVSTGKGLHNGKPFRSNIPAIKRTDWSIDE